MKRTVVKSYMPLSLAEMLSIASSKTEHSQSELIAIAVVQFLSRLDIWDDVKRPGALDGQLELIGKA